MSGGAGRTTRIGVVADTHVGEFLDRLPPAVPRALAGVDLVMHAGDISVPSVLDELSAIAPVLAVRGDHDRFRDPPLPERLVLTVAGRRLGLVHGRRLRAVEAPAAVLSLASGRLCLLGFHAAVRRRFGPLDCLVHGHLHIPVCRRLGDLLLFSPGAVQLPERDPDRYLTTARGRALLRFRSLVPAELRRPSVGVLEVGPAGVRGEIVPID